jgi:hypothetical protein
LILGWLILEGWSFAKYQSAKWSAAPCFEGRSSAEIEESCRMANTMRAAVVRTLGKPLTIEEVPVPVPGPGEVLVKVIACGVCHTDLHAADGDWPVKPTPPFIPGHEAAGMVAAVGPGVTELKEGDAVGVA